MVISNPARKPATVKLERLLLVEASNCAVGEISFHYAMTASGCSRHRVRHALRRLRERGWIDFGAGLYRITDEGVAALATPEGT